MKGKVIITITVQEIDYDIFIDVPVKRLGINPSEIERRAKNIFHEFSIKKVRVKKEEKNENIL